ncbi:MAG TPA: GNAT family protein [Croceibacterium sp.]|nr:GNAT family protein [Croceibacterium sp.]
MADVLIETARLVLRGERPGDREAWLAEINSAETMEHLGGPKTTDAVHADFDRMAGDSEFPWVLIGLKPHGGVIGKCGLGPIDTQAAPDELRGRVQVGWTIGASHWRQGYGREAAAAMLDLAFGRYGQDTVYAQTSERNLASFRLMESLGMTRRAELDYDDPDFSPEDNPTIIYAITRQEWLSR